MKYVFIAITLLVIVLLVARSYNLKYTTGIETYKFEVIKEYRKFEVRKYEASLFTYVNINASTYKESSKAGFRTLAGYIFGYNEKRQKIAMTSPVAMNMNDSVTMMFMVPSQYKLEDLPNPIDESVKFKEEPAKTVAAIKFKGWANDDKIEKYKQKLINYLKEEGIEHTNKFVYLGYNPPYEILNRKNELIVELKK